MNAKEVSHALSAAMGGAWRAEALGASGFCATWQARGGEGARLFVKSGRGTVAAQLEAEADGLRHLNATRTVRVPHVEHAEPGLLALEWLELRPPDAGFGERFGAALARLHAAPAPIEGYGWTRDNLIGATPQDNTPSADWLGFFARHRLQAMTARLRDGRLAEAVDEVIARLPALFDDGHAPRPSLIHGDLWSGNWGMLADGTPVIYDPAVSCSDAEAELAMMELFGSPPRGFWEAYRRDAGLSRGYARRRPLYQLYHLLNHAVLFGGGYPAQALQVAHELSRAA